MIQPLNENLSLDKIKMPYPHVELLDPSDAVALVVPSLTEGDLPVICKYKGSTRKIGSIAYSALTLNTLLKLSRLVFHKDEGKSFNLNNTLDIMEVL